MVYGETGFFPINIDIQCRVIAYWAKLISSDVFKLSGIMYKVIYSSYKYSNIRNTRFCWIRNVKHILDSYGMSGILQSHIFRNEKWLVCAVKQKLRDIFITNWHAQLDISSSGITYSPIKTNFGMENYLVTLPLKLRKPLIQIRTRNHRLPMETGRWLHIPREERICNLCNDRIGDKFHFILECRELKDLRRQYLKAYYHKKQQQMSWNFTSCSTLKIKRNYLWMDELWFYVPSTVFQSFRNDGRVNMKGSVQWNAV